MPPQAKPAVATSILWTFILLPLFVYLVFLPAFGSLQNNDYYYILGRLIEGDGFSKDAKLWLTVKSNEHRATVPALI